jgi:hypothetical protein
MLMTNEGKIGYAEHIKPFLADTFAMVAFSVVIGAFVELVITRLSLEQTIKIRLAAAPISVVLGRPYGLYRDWLFNKFCDQKSSNVRKLLLDTIANLSFQIPVYSIILAINGASLVQIFTAVLSVFLIVSVSGRPYGIFLSTCRRLFRVSSP